MINRKMDAHRASKPGPAEAEDKGDQQELSWKAAHVARLKHLEGQYQELRGKDLLKYLE